MANTKKTSRKNAGNTIPSNKGSGKKIAPAVQRGSGNKGFAAQLPHRAQNR